MRVYIGVPLDSGGLMHYGIGNAFVNLTTNRGNIDLAFDCRSAKPVENVRNQLVKNVLDLGFDYLLMFDSDNPPTAEKNPLDLVLLDKDVIILPTPIWSGKDYLRGTGRNPLIWNVYNDLGPPNGWVQFDGQRQGLQEVDAGGTGSILISRQVLEHPKMRPAFYREMNDDGICTIGSDLLFCRRARDAGFKIWAHFDYWCHHFKTVDLVAVHNTIEVRDIKHANRRRNPNTPEYWDQEWLKRKERILPQYDLICQKIKKLANKRTERRPFRVCDVGCGRGDLLLKLKEIPSVEPFGVDFSMEAGNICRARGVDCFLSLDLVPSTHQPIDCIVSTELLEHVEHDGDLLEYWFRFTDDIIYSVPNDCLPPGMEKEHLRIYNERHVADITPHLKDIEYAGDGDYLVVTAKKEQIVI